MSHPDDHETAESLEILGRIRKALLSSMTTAHLVSELDEVIARIEHPLPPAATRGLWWFQRAIEVAIGEAYEVQAVRQMGPGHWDIAFCVRRDPEGVLFQRPLHVPWTGTVAHTQAAAYRKLVKGEWKIEMTETLERALKRAARKENPYGP